MTELKERLLEKVCFEWEMFFLAKTATSKANIFAMSDEITRKKRIMKNLKIAIDQLSDQTIAKIILLDNLLEECYRFEEDNPTLATREVIRNFLKKFQE